MDNRLKMWFKHNVILSGYNERQIMRISVNGLILSLLLFGWNESLFSQKQNAIPDIKPEQQRIAIVNLDQVYRQCPCFFDVGDEFLELRTSYSDKIDLLLNKMFQIEEEYKASVIKDPQHQDIGNRMLKLQHQIEIIDHEADQKLPSLLDQQAIKHYRKLQDLLNRIAEANKLGLVLCYQEDVRHYASPLPDMKKILEPDALRPIYHRGIDITDVVIRNLAPWRNSEDYFLLHRDRSFDNPTRDTSKIFIPKEFKEELMSRRPAIDHDIRQERLKKQEKVQAKHLELWAKGSLLHRVYHSSIPKAVPNSDSPEQKNVSAKPVLSNNAYQHNQHWWWKDGIFYDATDYRQTRSQWKTGHRGQ